MTTAYRKKKLQICSELMTHGFVKGSPQYTKEYKKLYQRMRRKLPTVKIKEQKIWMNYYQSRGQKWNRERISRWRKLNPLKWKAITQRASKNGIHKRFYDKHKVRINEEKALYGRIKRRKEPTFGLRKAILEARKSSNIEELARKCLDAISKLNETSRSGGSKSTNRSGSLPMRKRNSQNIKTKF